jgi:hypothetical protein
MAFESDKRRGSRPDKFKAVINAVTEADPEGVKQLQSLSDELDTLPGRLAGKISKWQKEGLGRVIGVPIPSYLTNDAIVGGQYQRMAYALPVTDESVSGPDRRVAIVFASGEDEKHKVRLVGPRQSTHKEEDVRKIENNNYTQEFEDLFRPSREPALVDQWEREPKDPANESFTKNIKIFPIDDHSDELGTTGTTCDDIIDEAVIVARRLKVNGIQTDEYTFKNLLGDNADELAILNRDWDELAQEETFKAKTQQLETKVVGDPEAL